MERQGLFGAKWLVEVVLLSKRSISIGHDLLDGFHETRTTLPISHQNSFYRVWRIRHH